MKNLEENQALIESYFDNFVVFCRNKYEFFTTKQKAEQFVKNNNLILIKSNEIIQ